MTPTPKTLDEICDEFCEGLNPPAEIRQIIQAYADQEVAKAVASQQTMRWVKAKNELPDFGDEEFHLRCKRGDIMDRWTALYDESVKEFYMVKEYCIMDYFSLDDYPDIEWLLDESPAPTT